MDGQAPAQNNYNRISRDGAGISIFFKDLQIIPMFAEPVIRQEKFLPRTIS